MTLMPITAARNSMREVLAILVTIIVVMLSTAHSYHWPSDPTTKLNLTVARECLAAVNGIPCAASCATNTPCNGGFGFCKAPTKGGARICTRCGVAPGDACCPGAALCLYGNGKCTPQAAGSVCVSCDNSAPSCCSTAQKKCAWRHGRAFCKAVPGQALPACVPCGDYDQPCCPGSAVGSECEDGRGYCVKRASTAKLLYCKLCGRRSEECCPGAQAGSECDNGAGFCKQTPTGLQCVQHPDCNSPGAKLGSPCIAAIGGYRGFCTKALTGLRCTRCGAVGERCCRGTEPQYQCEPAVSYCNTTTSRCIECGIEGGPCCPGAKLNSECRAMSDAYAVCVPGASGEGLHCTECGFSRCCPGHITPYNCYENPSTCEIRSTGDPPTCKTLAS